MQGSQNIRDIILSYGFHAVGIARYGLLDDDRSRLNSWIEGGNHAAKEYLASNPRHDPHTILPACKSVVVALFAPQRQAYHSPIRRSLKRLLKLIQTQYPDVHGRGVVDTAPIFEKSWAVRAGLGSIGRNTLLVHPTLGTNFNIGILLLDVELPYDEPFAQELCPPHCELCIDACPSGALYGDRTLDCRVCLAYISQITPQAEYGCTICQQCCPYNAPLPQNMDCDGTQQQQRVQEI